LVARDQPLRQRPMSSHESLVAKYDACCQSLCTSFVTRQCCRLRRGRDLSSSARICRVLGSHMKDVQRRKFKGSILLVSVDINRHDMIPVGWKVWQSMPAMLSSYAPLGSLAQAQHPAHRFHLHAIQLTLTKARHLLRMSSLPTSLW